MGQEAQVQESEAWSQWWTKEQGGHRNKEVGVLLVNLDLRKHDGLAATQMDSTSSELFTVLNTWILLSQNVLFSHFTADSTKICTQPAL